MGYFYGNYIIVDDTIQLELLEELIIGDTPSKYSGEASVIFDIDKDDLVMTSDFGESREGDTFTRSTDIVSTNMPIDERIPADVSPFRAGQAIGFVAAEGGLNMRSGPGTEYDSIILVPDGYPTRAFGTSKVDNKWYFVEYENTLGYVNSEYIELGYM